MISGTYKSYFWIEWLNISLDRLVTAFPELVYDKYLAITSFDSGLLLPTEEERKAGWSSVDDITYSPIVEDIQLLPSGQYDEWYVFLQPPLPFQSEVFVNYGIFSLRNTEVHGLSGKVAQAQKQRQHRFWAQFERLEPETYLAQGDLTLCVTRNQALFQRLSRWQA